MDNKLIFTYCLLWVISGIIIAVISLVILYNSSGYKNKKLYSYDIYSFMYVFYGKYYYNCAKDEFDV